MVVELIGFDHETKNLGDVIQEALLKEVEVRNEKVNHEEFEFSVAKEKMGKYLLGKGLANVFDFSRYFEAVEEEDESSDQNISLQLVYLVIELREGVENGVEHIGKLSVEIFCASV